MAEAALKDKKAEPSAPVSAPSKVKLRYLGTSHRYVDQVTGLVFIAGGDSQAVSEEDAKRLLSSPFDSFEKE